MFVYELHSMDMSTKFTLVNCLFGAEVNKKCWSGIGFDARSDFSINGEWDKNVVIFDVDNKLSY